MKVSIHPASWSTAYTMPSQSVRETRGVDPCLDSEPCWPVWSKTVKLRQSDDGMKAKNLKLD